MSLFSCSDHTCTTKTHAQTAHLLAFVQHLLWKFIIMSHLNPSCYSGSPFFSDSIWN
jgi:hypothetical protein